MLPLWFQSAFKRKWNMPQSKLYLMFIMEKNFLFYRCLFGFKEQLIIHLLFLLCFIFVLIYSSCQTLFNVFMLVFRNKNKNRWTEDISYIKHSQHNYYFFVHWKSGTNGYLYISIRLCALVTHLLKIQTTLHISIPKKINSK